MLATGVVFLISHKHVRVVGESPSIAGPSKQLLLTGFIRLLSSTLRIVVDLITPYITRILYTARICRTW